MRSAYALRSERKISDTDNYLPFFHRQITSLSHRPNFFYQNTIMSTPPPLPSVDYTAIADLHTAGAASTTLAPPLFNFIRKGVFDTERFVKSQENVYLTEEMSKFDAKFQKEVCFNFSATRNTQRKFQRQERSSRSAATINLNSVDDGTSDYRNLSRYILEDLLRCKEGTNLSPMPSHCPWGHSASRSSCHRETATSIRTWWRDLLKKTAC